MTARIVIYSLGPHRPSDPPRFHRESPIAGYPDCGAPITTVHRAIAVDDERLCGQCWGVSEAENPSDSGRIATKTQDVERPDRERANVSTGPTHSLITQRAGSDE